MIFAPYILAPKYITVPAGTYEIGGTNQIKNPRRKIKLKSFEIAAYETTNSQFAEFITASGYVTTAEKSRNGMTFRVGLKEFRWLKSETAQWRFPNGKDQGGLANKWHHPVTSISFQDAEAYCRWAKVRLPSLEEWEVASRAGADSKHFFEFEGGVIGDYANIWHGQDHLKPDLTDGYLTTSPVGKFNPNPWGLYDVYGNVFEFCSGRLPGDSSLDTVHARGGSWWCSKNSCSFFNSCDIGKVNRRATFSNLGFRTVRLSNGKSPH